VLIALPAGSPKIGTYNLTPARVIDMLSGLHYINIHSANFGSGEIRGQVIEDPDCIPTVTEWGFAVMTLLILTAGTVVFMWSRSRSTV
jgi:hypothetical protein